ncbi:MAG: sulfite exporter TauE/SafE family protein [Balneolaceae bacterium]|nr:sulfite exporter TauE/SafE family protein [Balneolaceae bacterium]
MLETTFIILLGLGLVAGILAGLLGIGGGILFTPVLFVIFSDAGIADPVVLTIGTSLFCTFIAAFGSSVRQYRQKNFYWKDGLIVGLLGALGVTVGKWVITAPFYSKQVFVIFFSLLLLYVAWMFIRRGRKNPEEKDIQEGGVTKTQAGVSGGLGGFVAALGGIGGGGVMVPIFNLYYKKPFKKVVSISSLAIVFISLSGWLQLALAGSAQEALTDYAIGYIDFGAAFPLCIGAMTGGFLGALINLKIKQLYLQYGFALLAAGMAVKLLVEVF